MKLNAKSAADFYVKIFGIIPDMGNVRSRCLKSSDIYAKLWISLKPIAIRSLTSFWIPARAAGAACPE